MSTPQNNLKKDGPITSICVVENIAKCPEGFNVISKTYGDNADADLWKETSFFHRITRYLCISKSEQIADYIVEDIRIVNEKESLPIGYSMIPKTMDTDLKAWRKRQLCYKLRRKDICTICVKDIAVVGKNSNPPAGYKKCGEINGMLICYQVGQLRVISQQPQQSKTSIFSSLYPSANPLENGSTAAAATAANDNNGSRLSNGGATVDNNHNYQNIYSPEVPPPVPSRTTSSSSMYQGLQGVPFIINPRLEQVPKSLLEPVTVRKYKSRMDIENEYKFEFEIDKYILS